MHSLPDIEVWKSIEQSPILTPQAPESFPFFAALCWRGDRWCDNMSRGNPDRLFSICLGACLYDSATLPSSLNKCILRTWELGLGLLAWLYKAKLKVEDGSGKWLFCGLQCASFPWFSLIIPSADAAGRVHVNSLLKMRTRSLRTGERGLCEGGACTALVHGGCHG